MGVTESLQNIVGRTIKDINFGQFKTIVLIIDEGDGKIEKLPGPDTVIKDGSWLYIGMNPNATDENVQALETLLGQGIDGKAALPSPKGKRMSLGKIVGRIVTPVPKESKRGLEPSVLNARNISRQGTLLHFTLEFDCFTFPEQIGKDVSIGPAGLDMRKKFNINLAGVVKPDSEEPIWFPHAHVKVSAGDIGLVVRRPLQDGSSEPTATDAEIENLQVVAE